MNKRAPEMWDLVTDRVDFTDKLVMDIGCGTGDFLWRAMEAGAEHVYGIEIDPDTAREARRNCKKMGHEPTVFIEDACDLEPADYDVAICFSVIPYLGNPVKVMDWMSLYSDISLVECQYHGDGPGPSNLKNDEDMAQFLGVFWDHVEPIGSTDVVIRPAKRTIWLCTN